MQEIGREQAIHNLGLAYMKVKEGKAGCVMIMLEGDEIEVVLANLDTVDALRAVHEVEGDFLSQVCRYL